MGRRRKKQYLTKTVKRDKGKPEKVATQTELTGFMEKSNGAVASNIRALKLATRQPDGTWKTDPNAIKERVNHLRVEIREDREHDRKYLLETAAHIGGMTTKQAENAINREKRDEALAVIAAAKAGNVKLTPADYRVLTPMREGRYLQAVYGKENQWEQGTLATRGRRKTARSKDPAHHARMKENTERLREHRPTIGSKSDREQRQQEHQRQRGISFFNERPKKATPNTALERLIQRQHEQEQRQPANDIIF